MGPRSFRQSGHLLVLCLLMPLGCAGQSINSSISGVVTDPSGSVIPNANCTLKSVGTVAVAKFTTSSDGLYRFGNLQQGVYDLEVSAQGFQTYVQRGISLNISERVTQNVTLQVGSAIQTLEVRANASPLNFEDATHKGEITPQILSQLPLAVSGNSRSATSFVILLPGVNTAAGNNPFEARINGGMKMGDEAALDGVSMQEGLMSQSGMVALDNDYPMSPEAISEVSVLTSTYEPRYGTTTSGVIMAVTKSGTNEFHGDLREFLHNTVLNARQWGAPDRPKDIENQFGGSIGGPIKIPGVWSGRSKAYFFLNYERWTIRGGTKFPVLSIPSLKERQGDFSDWVDSDGNLIPVYDPNTTRPNPSFDPNLPVGPTNLPFLRDQFMGCDGKTPNVICPTDNRLQNSLAQQWFKYLPTPTFPGPLNNFVSPLAESDISGAGTDHRQSWDIRIDEYLGTKDHFSASIHNHNTVFSNRSNLPAQISHDSQLLPNGGEIGPWNIRFNLDHTFTPTLLNNFNYGYMGMRGSEIADDARYVDSIPKIPGVANYKAPPEIDFSDGFESMGLDILHYEARPTNIVNDLVTWVHGKHTLKFGGEVRALENNLTDNNNESGTFAFADVTTGLLGINSGNPIASFLFGLVDNGNASFNTVNNNYGRAKLWDLHVGDTWKVTPKLSVTYGIRWDVSTPSYEKYDHFTFLDPLGPNSGAGNLPGRLAYAGSRYRPASFGRRHPEINWYHAFSPRLGIAYALTPRTVIRTGYGIFYNQAFYPGWNSGIGQDGFNFTPSFSSTNGGLTPAFTLAQGLPQDFQRPPFIDSALLNGQDGPTYRPFDANRLTYAQQWNLTVDHQFTSDFYISAAYVGNKGSRLPSNTSPLNALNPKYLSMGQQLYHEFAPGDTELDGVRVPYQGWVDQMQNCAPSVAQALRPFPQYCGGLFGENENAGKSFYNSFQVKAEHRVSKGLWFLGSYTLSKLLATADSVQSVAMVWSRAEGAISPYERQRNKSLSVDDVPQILQLSLMYDLPVGKGKRFLNVSGPVDKVLGGWQLVSLFRVSSGVPFFFRSSFCNVPDAFTAACIPAIPAGAKPYLQSVNSYNPDKGPLFNSAAFEDPNSFNFYWGRGARISNLRGPGYRNHDLSLIKNTRVTEKVGLQFRAEFFNAWNWHSLNCTTRCFGATGFDTDVSSPTFGQWNGNVSTPRNIQFAMKILF